MIYFIILLAGLLLGNGYVYLKGLAFLSIAPLWGRVCYSVLFAVLALSFFIVMFTLRHAKLPCGAMQAIFHISTGWLVFILYMVLTLLAFDLLHMCGVAVPGSFLWAACIVCTVLTVGYRAHRHPAVREIPLRIDKNCDLPQHRLRIAYCSDIHLGYGTGPERMEEFAAMIGATAPDVILIGGDLIDNGVEPLERMRMEKAVARLHAPLGVYMVPGNHEYISGIGRSLAFLKRTPVRVLRDSVATLPGGVQIVGRDDRSNPSRRPLAELLEKADPSLPVIVLDHQPNEVERASALPVDLLLCGHTHHGQVWSANWITDRIFPQSHGYRRWGTMHAYVSSGLSLWGPPFRIGTRGELVVFDLSFSETPREAVPAEQN